MGVRRPSSSTPARPSSIYLEKLLNIQLKKKQFPTQIWPEDHQKKPEPPPASSSLLKLSHPLLRALDTCAPGSTPKLSQIHAQLTISGLAQHPLAAGRLIKTLSSSPTSLPLATSLFASLSHPDAFIANTLLRAHLSTSPQAALAFYLSHVHPKGLQPNHYTFPLLANLFARLRLTREGHILHLLIFKSGLNSNIYINNSLIYMYCSFAHMEAALRLFHEMPGRDLVTWNTILSGYLKNGMPADARRVFNEMPDRDVVSWNVMIAGHAGGGEMEAARELLAEMPERDVVSWNTMIDGYARIGDVVASRDVFDGMPDRNLVSWNSILALYARRKEHWECLKLFDGMMAEGDVRPNEATLVSVLTACANLGLLDRGRWVHSLIKNVEMRLEPDVLLSTALLTMYAKCGAMELAREVFDGMVERSVVSWNSMIVGYGFHGDGQKAMELFLEMEKTGMRPSEATFVCILSACAHGGMVLEGWWCFRRMIRCYGIEPKVDHFGCMVDLLGRAGLVKDSVEVIKTMPAGEGPVGPTLWGALLSACRTHSEAELGELVGRKLIEMEPREVGPYVLLSNMYAARGRWDEVERVREMMGANGLHKTAGASFVGLCGYVSDPLGKESSSSASRKSMVYSMLGEMGSHIKVPCREFRGKEDYRVHV